MRDVIMEETIVAGEFRYRVADSCELDRLKSRGVLSRAQHDAGMRMYSDWYSSGMGGRGKTGFERSSGKWSGGRYEVMSGKEESNWVQYCKARGDISRDAVHEVANVCLYDLCCSNVTVLKKGLDQLVKHYKIDPNT